MKVKYLINEEDIEENAKQQIAEVIKEEKVRELVIFPDVHAGYSLPIGSACFTDKDFIKKE